MLKAGQERRKLVTVQPTLPEKDGTTPKPVAAAFDVDGTIVRTTVVHYYLLAGTALARVAEWPGAGGEDRARAAGVAAPGQEEPGRLQPRVLTAVYNGLDAGVIKTLAAKRSTR